MKKLSATESFFVLNAIETMICTDSRAGECIG